jgi:hypothetical protein
MELKMVTIKFKSITEFPAFLNFRESVLEEFVADVKVSTIESVTARRIIFLNDKLKDFNAVYIWNGERDSFPARLPTRVVEFSSEEDYAHFILKWS